MQAKLLAALAMGNLAMGMTSSVKYMNTTAATTSMKSTTSMSKTMTATSTSAVASDPATAPGGFVAVGCIQSTDGFSGFFLTVSSASNSINFCAASCSSNQYFGVSGEYVTLNSVTSILLPDPADICLAVTATVALL